MKKTIIASALWLLSVPISVHLTSAPAPVGSSKAKNQPTPQLTAVDCKVTLSFFRDNFRTCIQLPTDQANPALKDGAASLATATTLNTYFCKITVEPNAPSANFNAANYKFTWTKRGAYTTIKVPKDVSSKITVEFYENCNQCMDNSRGIPLFRYTNILQKGQPYCNAFLQYSAKLPC